MKNIAIFIGQIYLDSQRKVLMSIYDECKKYNYNFTVYSFFSSTEDNFNIGEYELYNRINLDNFDGFIIYSETIYSETIRNQLLEKFINTNRKFVSIDNYLENAVNVISDGESSMEKIAENLAKMNDIKIVNYITGPLDSNDSNKRINAFKKTAEEFGIAYDPNRVYVGDFFSESGNLAIEYFRNNNLLDADVYVCANDQMALGAYFGLSELGINVPEECLITGFDNTLQSKFNTVPITSVERNEKGLGKAAFIKLMEILKGKETKDRVIEATPVFRESTNVFVNAPSPSEKEAYYSSFVKKTFNDMKYASILNDVNTEFMTAKSVDELCDILVKYLKRFKIEEFYLCLDDCKDAEYVNVALAYKNGLAGKNLRMEKKKIIKSISGNMGGDFNIVNPLHYSDTYYGYTIVKNYMSPLENEYYNSLVMNISNMLRAIDDYKKMSEMLHELQDVSKYDQLTHLYNRKGFFDEADKIFDTYKDKDNDMFIIFIDLDGLKIVNDNLGHKYGDMFICDFANILKSQEIAKTTITMRFGGDEFVIFGKDKTEEEILDLLGIIDIKINRLNSLKKAEYYPYELGASMGYYKVSNQDTSLYSVIDKADKDMYAKKLEKKIR